MAHEDPDGAPETAPAPPRAEDEQVRVAALRAYLEAGAERPPPPPIRGGSLLRMVPAWAPGAFRAAGTRVLRHRAHRRLQALTEGPPPRLHLGCGWTYKEGWVNVDLFATRADICWDLSLGLPLPDGSVRAIFHEHLLEHLGLSDGFALTRECRRVLAPGGILRIGVPDAGACVDSYAGRADPEWARSRPTGMLAVQALFYENGHRAMYDGETLRMMCRAAGFAEAERREAGEGWMQPSPDTPERRSGTLYVEAR